MRQGVSLAGRTALITGASSGIGYELAKLCARDGCHLVLVARDAARLARVADGLERSCRVKVTALPKDLAGPRAADAIADELQRLGIEIDILINNAGTQVYGEFAASCLEQQLALIQVNAAALVHLTHRLLPGMLRRGYGRILNVGSTGSFAPGPLNAVYCATKAFVASFSQAIGAELAGTGVTVTALCPGATDTAFAARYDMRDVRMFRRMMPASQVAQLGYRALMRGHPLVVPGLSNQLQVLAFQLSAPGLAFTPPAWLMAIGQLFMGRVGDGRQRVKATR